VPCESSNAFLKSLVPSARWIDATALLYELRATKTEQEIARLRLVHRVAGFGLKRFCESAAPGKTEAELAAEVYAACLTQGVRLRQARHINVYPQVSSGVNACRAWRPVVTTGARRLRKGEIALLELAVCVDGFWADVTRVKVAGKPSRLQQDVFAAVASAQKAALAAIGPGVEAQVPHDKATQVLVRAGFEKYMIHLTGHGLGFRYHEPEPFLMPGNTMPLRTGHVCSVEPGLYGAEFGGVRLEDNVVVTAEGVENLTKAAKTF
jgi:Xaa-Pro dipeptidase